MPELPEVETIATDLDEVLRGKEISTFVLIDNSKVLHTPAALFKKSIIGKKIKKIYRRAKMVVIDLGTQVIVIHLKMTGQLIYTSKKRIIAGGHPIASTGVQVPNAYTRLIFSFKAGGELYFNDLRKFGWVKLLAAEDFIALAGKVGIEPLSKDFTLAYFRKIIARRGRAPIKAVLLDQKHVAGLGNIYVDEVLFRAGVRPSRRTESLDEKEIKRIYQAIPFILRQAIEERGTTFKNFLDPAGLRGNFVPFLQVYGRGGKECKKCGRPLRKTRVAGRGTHWCEHCQH